MPACVSMLEARADKSKRGGGDVPQDEPSVTSTARPRSTRYSVNDEKPSARESVLPVIHKLRLTTTCRSCRPDTSAVMSE